MIVVERSLEHEAGGQEHDAGGEHAQLVERRELRRRLAAVDEHGDRQRHAHQQAAEQEAERHQVVLPSCSRYQPTWPTTSRASPITMLKISSFSQTVRWLSTCRVRNIRAASVMAITRYHRRQPACRTSHAASRLSATSDASRTTSDQWICVRCVRQAAERQQAAATNDSDIRALAHWKAGSASPVRSHSASR